MLSVNELFEITQTCSHKVFINSVSNITKYSSSECAMDQGLRPPSIQALNCLIKVCSGFQVDYLLCDDYENENEMIKFSFVK